MNWQTKPINQTNQIKLGVVVVMVAMVMQMFFGAPGTNEVHADDDLLTPTVTVTPTGRGICTEFQC